MLRSKVAREGWWWWRRAVGLVAVRTVRGGRRDRECGGAAVRAGGIDAVDATTDDDDDDEEEEEEEGRDCCSVLRRSIGVVISLQSNGAARFRESVPAFRTEGEVRKKQRKGREKEEEDGRTQRSKDAARGSGGGDLRQGRFGFRR